MNTVNITLEERKCGGGGGGANIKRFSMYRKLCSSRQTENWRATFYHEFFHVFGLNHMQTRFDRDKYVKVQYEHINDGDKPQFNICPEARCPAYGPYECESIMHYERVMQILFKCIYPYVRQYFYIHMNALLSFGPNFGIFYLNEILHHFCHKNRIISSCVLKLCCI